jgi:CBS domain containing-hemolysin-like protein
MSAMAWPLVASLLLLLANALFVAAEFSLVSAPRASLEHLALRGHRSARRVLDIIDDPAQRDRYLATVQIGVSVASLALGMYGEHAIAAVIGDALGTNLPGRISAHVVASAVAIAMLTYAHIVVGEMLPKTLALQAATWTAIYTVPAVEVLQQVLRPVVWLLNAVSALVLRSTGLDRTQSATERYHDPEELQIIIQESQEGGQLRHDAGELLRELFEFGNLTASEVMVPRVQMTSVRVGADADELRRIVRARLHTRYPVHTGNPDDILGSLHIKDIIRHLVSGEPISMLDVRPVPYVPVTAQLDEVLTAMRRSRSHMAVALDEHGGTAGIVTIEDLFQEVVGTIGDTGDVTPPVPGQGGAWTARGTTRLRDVGEALGITFEYPDVQSVSGLVLALLGRPPVRGDAVVWAGIRIEVTAVDGRGVQEAALSRL